MPSTKGSPMPKGYGHGFLVGALDGRDVQLQGLPGRHEHEEEQAQVCQPVQHHRAIRREDNVQVLGVPAQAPSADDPSRIPPWTHMCCQLDNQK